MLKKFLALSFIFFFSFINYPLAHTHIESSSPASEEVLNEELKEITLTFEGKIEQSSSFTLQNVAGDEIPVDDISVSENILTGSLTTPLENGDYLINWNIIGADGHLIEGEIPFTIDIPVTDTNTNSDGNSTVEDSADADLVKDNEEVGSAVEDNSGEDDIDENSSSSYLLPTLIGLLILIVIGSFLFIAKRKQ